MKIFFAICLLLCVALLPGRGEDDTLNNVYHSLSRLGNNVRNTFTEDSDDRPSPTPRRHRKSTQTFIPRRRRLSSLIRRVNRRRRALPTRTRNRNVRNPQRRRRRMLRDRLPARKSRVLTPTQLRPPNKKLVLIPKTSPNPPLRWPR